MTCPLRAAPVNGDPAAVNRKFLRRDRRSHDQEVANLNTTINHKFTPDVILQ
jgi:hypothetical protein